MKDENNISDSTLTLIPKKFLADLMDNTIECLNQELQQFPHRSEGSLANIYRAEIAKCEEILKQNE